MINELFNKLVDLQKYINNRCKCQSELLDNDIIRTQRLAASFKRAKLLR